MSSGAALATSGDGSVTAPDIAEAVFRKLAGAGLPTEALRLVAVPGGTQTRWLLPAGERGIGSVLASWTPYRAWPRLAWSVVRAASGVRRSAALPGVASFDVQGVVATSWQSLGWRWSGVPIPVIYVGTPGPNRKAVVHLVEPATSQCRAVVKVPLTDVAKAAILHEAGVLQALECDRYPHAPRLLYTDPARGISTQTFIAGRPGTRKLAPDYFRLLRTLLRADKATSLAAHSDRWAPHNDTAWAVRELRDDTPLPACWEHGDFTPWNIRRLSNGECAVLDWESARADGLPLIDAFHFLHMQDFLFGERPRLQRSHPVATKQLPWASAPRQLRKLEIAYLLAAAAECARSGNAERMHFAEHALELMPEQVA